MAFGGHLNSCLWNLVVYHIPKLSGARSATHEDGDCDRKCPIFSPFGDAVGGPNENPSARDWGRGHFRRLYKHRL